LCGIVCKRADVYVSKVEGGGDLASYINSYHLDMNIYIYIQSIA
jgi:hypothetical protein